MQDIGIEEAEDAVRRFVGMLACRQGFGCLEVKVERKKACSGEYETVEVSLYDDSGTKRDTSILVFGTDCASLNVLLSFCGEVAAMWQFHAVTGDAC